MISNSTINAPENSSRSHRDFFLTYFHHILLIKIRLQRLPWWSRGWESACQCRGHGFHLWARKIPHATEQLSLCVTSTEACMPRTHAVKQGKSHHFEKPVHHSKEEPPLATARESQHAATKTQSSRR